METEAEGTDAVEVEWDTAAKLCVVNMTEL